MRLTPKEQEKLMLHMAGNLAKERKERGVTLLQQGRKWRKQAIFGPYSRRPNRTAPKLGPQ